MDLTLSKLHLLNKCSLLQVCLLEMFTMFNTLFLQFLASMNVGVTYNTSSICSMNYGITVLPSRAGYYTKKNKKYDINKKYDKLK